MDFVTWGQSPWGQDILIHVSWTLLYVAAAAGVAFMVAHTLWVRLWPKAVGPSASVPVPAPVVARIPERVKRHSLAARLFHWIMAAAMLTLLVTAFLPIVGIQFGWVTIHWVAGLVLTVSVLYHIIHATFWLDFWSIWLNKDDVAESWTRLRRAFGAQVAAPRKAGKYPTDNKLYHTAIIATGFAVIGTGLFMMTRIRTPLFTRNPYLFSDQTWGLLYVLHGLAGVGLITLTLAHIYFAVRPEKFWITKSMLFGWITRRQYLEHHDPQRWVVAQPGPSAPAGGQEERKVAV
jgi:cytochrome b subunit of formate dehydrogenase